MASRRAIRRRSFLARTLAGTGAAVLAPAFVPASALGNDDSVAPSDRIGVGIIGVGRQDGAYNRRQLLALPDVQVVAVCDVDAWRLENARKSVDEHYGQSTPSGTSRGCAVYGDFRELLARDDIDAVMISTPDHWHAPMALAAFDAGKDVSLEKPITRTIAEGRQISDASARLNRVFRVDSEFRTKPGVRQAATLVRNGRIGKVQRVEVGVPQSDVGCPPQPEMPVPEELDYERWQGPAPRAFYTERRVHKPKAYERPGWMRHLYYCDGMITNWGTHTLNGALWAADLDRSGPVEVEGTGVYPPADSFWNVLLQFSIRYRFANGIECVYATGRPYFRIEGTEGWVEADFRQVKAEPESLLTAQFGPDDVQFPAAAQSDKRNFIDCVKSREETLEPAEVGHRVTSMCHLGHIAVQMDGVLKWDPDKERFTNNDAANAWLDKPIHSPRQP
ncbi:MAG: Gfo/Idh/MocA family oxidoreductase [Paracoccaceae bacterium]